MCGWGLEMVENTAAVWDQVAIDRLWVTTQREAMIESGPPPASPPQQAQRYLKRQVKKLWSLKQNSGGKHVQSLGSIIAAVTLCLPLQACAQETISGTPGVATDKAVVNLKDLAEKEKTTPTAPGEPGVAPRHRPIPHDLPQPADITAPPDGDQTEKPNTKGSR